MPHVTTTRAALAAAGLAVLAEVLPPALGMYATIVAAAVLMVTAFVSYLDVVDRPSLAAVAESAACATAGLLVFVDAALRFPELIDGGGPPAAALLARGALALVVAAALAPLAAGASRTALARVTGRAEAPVDEAVPARAARRWRRTVGAH